MVERMNTRAAHLDPGAVLERLQAGQAVLAADDDPIERLCLQHLQSAASAVETLITSAAALKSLAPAPAADAVASLFTVATCLPSFLDRVKRVLWPDPQFGPCGECHASQSIFRAAAEALGEVAGIPEDPLVDSSFLRAEVEAAFPRGISVHARRELMLLLTEYPRVHEGLARRLLDIARKRVVIERWADQPFGVLRRLRLLLGEGRS
jgi:hypothetical protein